MQIFSAISASFVLAGLVVLRYTMRADEGPEVGAGAATGSLIFGLLFAWAARYAWVKSRGRGEVRSHWLLWLAVVGMYASIAMNTAEEVR